MIPRFDWKDEGESTMFTIRMGTHDIILGRMTKEAYKDIADTKRVMLAANRAMRRESSGLQP